MSRRGCWFQCSSASRKFLNVELTVRGRSIGTRFSALQRAENSSITRTPGTRTPTPSFSALQRAENSSILEIRNIAHATYRFSALQRAENSSIRCAQAGMRKRVSFSALQRAENSSIVVDLLRFSQNPHVSVLFSEPKIPQSVNQRIG